MRKLMRENFSDVGTIDKDYPKSVGGYAFEIGEPAVQKILCRARLAIQVEYVTVCRKDSQDITDGDRYYIILRIWSVHFCVK